VTAPRPGEVGSAAGSGPAAAARPRLSRRGFVAWVLLTGIAVALDGPTGAAVGVLVLAVFLADAPRRVIGAAGVLALVAAPVAVLVRGVPTDEDVSPAFVTGSLWPHHLVFAGVALLATFVVLDLWDHLRVGGRTHVSPVESPTVVPLARLRPGARVALVGVVALVAVASIVAVLAQ
jgi:hypothetical protein